MSAGLGLSELVYFFRNRRIRFGFEQYDAVIPLFFKLRQAEEGQTWSRIVLSLSEEILFKQPLAEFDLLAAS